VSPIDWRELPLVSEDEAEPPTTFGALMRRLRLDSERGDDVEAFDEGSTSQWDFTPAVLTSKRWSFSKKCSRSSIATGCRTTDGRGC
jgi:hypothetical protein